MRILDGGKKDYYDYIVGIYGIDSDITYDRRNSTVLSHDKYGFWEDYFAEKKLYSDREKEQKYGWHLNGDKYVYGYYHAGRIIHFILEVGNTHYLFEVERYIENCKVYRNIKLVKAYDVKDKKSIHPIALYGVVYSISRISGEHIEFIKGYVVENPILNNTFIPSYISAEDIYNKVYSYLIKEKEPKIEDKRTDIQKLESKGFDKRSSFRNPINKRPSKR